MLALHLLDLHVHAMHQGSMASWRGPIQPIQPDSSRCSGVPVDLQGVNRL